MKPRIIEVATAVPKNRYAQEDLLAMAGHDHARSAFFLNSDIRHRHLYFESGITATETIDEMNARARKGAAEIGGRAILKCLEGTGAAPADIDFLVTTTCTVTLCPHLDTQFIRDLNFRSSVQRTHIGDTGCASAMVSLQAAWNHLHAFPGHRALAAAVEICSAAYYRDGTMEAAIGEAIFADGAAAMCLANDGPGFEVLGHRSLIRSEHIGLMGFDFPGGFRRLVLAKEVRQVGASMLRDLVEEMLALYGLKKSDVRYWVLHSAGRKVLDNAQMYLGLSDEDLGYSRAVLRDYGNMSSATVMFVLEKVMHTGQPKPGDLAIMAALGPGFAAEGALLQWAS